jgi:hypothetical protein
MKLTRIIATTLLAAALGAVPAAAGNLDVLFEDYEAVRAALAKDDASGIRPPANRIVSAVEAELKNRKDDAAKPLSAIRTAARDLARSEGNLVAARAAFAPLSKGVLDLIAASPKLAEGKFLYVCPMVKDYGKWVQARKEIENPYMGSAMLRCAVPVKKPS